jgi:hypothetical protein
MTGEMLSSDRTFDAPNLSPRGLRACIHVIGGCGLTSLIASRAIDAALAFYNGLKVYPVPGDLIKIYDSTVPKVTLNSPSSEAPTCVSRH